MMIAPAVHSCATVFWRASLTHFKAVSREGVGGLAVLAYQRGVVALLAGVLTLPLETSPLTDKRSDYHPEALPGRDALGAQGQSLDTQPDNEQFRND